MFKKSSLAVFSLLFIIILLSLTACNSLFPPPEQTTYTIIAITGDNGSITPEGKITLAEGEDQSFAIVPDNGYEVSEVLIDGQSAGAIKEYTFTEIQQDHTIKATFKTIISSPSIIATPTYSMDATAEFGGMIQPSGTIKLKKGGIPIFYHYPGRRICHF